jgi:hypothetical protein
MLHREPLLVTLLKLVDRIPWPQESAQRRCGRPIVYSERLIVKALVIMIIRRLYTAYSLLAFLQQDTDLTCQLRELLTEAGQFPSRRTWERRLAKLPDRLSGLIGCLGRHLVMLLQPWASCQMPPGSGSPHILMKLAQASQTQVEWPSLVGQDSCQGGVIDEHESAAASNRGA